MTTEFADKVLQSLDAWALEDLEFNGALPCEHSQHPKNHLFADPAKYFIEVTVSCGCVHTYLICRSGLNRLRQGTTVNCIKGHGPTFPFTLKILDEI